MEALEPRQPEPEPGDDSGRGDGDRQPRVAVLGSLSSSLDLEGDEDGAGPERARECRFGRVGRRSHTVLTGLRKAAGLCGILVCAALMIKFLAIANKTMAARHGHVFVRKNQLLSTLRTVCDSPACQQYSWELQSSLDINCNPCHSLYGFVCGRWRRGNTVPSMRKASEARLMREVLRSLLTVNASHGETATTTADKVAALVHSCLHGRRETAELAAFLRARGILPYRQRSPADLLAILVDLSANWGIHLWFELHMGSWSNGTPAVYIGRSKALAEWATMVKKIRKTRAHRRSILNTLKIFGLPLDQQPEAVGRVSSVDMLISAASVTINSTANTGPLVISVETMAVLLTPSIPVRAWLDALCSVQPPEMNTTRGTMVHIESPSCSPGGEPLV
ncbi:hypothetical protein HPB48_011288 [Haemaphysalis longicornis]|uniref:Peptidase M13 N-terminal domain-containing protein n=1 Tax=Haemaphysalis longicornis TaxID=44386 RepID=A0A9J6GXS0_HAELO|nr:hypothetical protein HPB48_011288 [Haemaphysalis longicornis]